MNGNGPLDFQVYVGDADFKKTFNSMERRATSFTRHVDKEVSSLDATFARLGQVAAGAFAFTQLADLPQQLIRVRGEFQNLEIAFNTMLGSKEKGDALFQQSVKFAAQTPFNLKDVASGAKQLLAYGVASEEVIGTLRRLGDVSAGLSLPLERLTYLYGTTKTQGRLFAADLNQFVGSGIPLIKLLADQFGVAESEVKGLVEAGKVGFPEVQKAIDTLTNSGGMFAGLMEQQSKSLTGLYANFEDAVSRAMNNVAKSQEGLLGDSIKFATTVVENYEPILDVLKVVVATYGTYKAAIIATAAAQAIATRGGAVLAWLELAAGIRSAKDAQIAFNLATSKNPWVLAATALVTLISAVAIFRKEVTEANKSQERFLAITEKLNQKQAEESTKVEILARQIANESRSREDRNAKLKELIAISPAHFNALTLDNIATDKGTTAIREYSKALEEKLKLQANEEQIIANNKRIRDISTGVLDEEFQPTALERVKLFLEDNIIEQKNFKAAVEKRKRAALEALKDENSDLIKEAANGASKLGKVPVVTPPLATPKPAKVKSIAKEEKDIRIKTFAEEIEEKKQMFEIYNRWVETYGKQSADSQFKDLIARGDSYAGYLDQEIERLEQMQKVGYSGAFTDSDARDLDNLLNRRIEAKGGPSVVDQYRDSLEQASQEASTLTEYLGFLKQAQDALSASAPTKDVIAQKKITAEEIIKAQKERKEMLSGFLLNVEDSEEKRLEIETHYAELRNALEERFQDNKTAGYQKAIDAINKAEGEEMRERAKRIREASEEYKALVKAVDDAANSSGLFKQISAQKDLVAEELATNGYSERYYAEFKKLGDMQTALYSSIAGAVGELGQALAEVGGTMGDIGSALSGIAKQAGGLITIFDKNTTSTQKWGSAVQAATSLIGIIVNSAKQRKQAETEYYNAIISQQSQYNILLNEGIGMQSELNGNVFITDYEGKISDGIKMMSDAQVGYEKSLEALQQGRAKIGQRDKVDWGAVGSGAASGAALGAAIGTAIPVIGNVVGAVVGGVVGAVVGIFGGKKKKDTFGGLLDVFPELIDHAGNFNKALADSLVANNLVDESTKVLLQDTIAWTEQLEKAKAQIESVIVDLAGGLADGLRDGLVGAFEDGTSAAEAWGSGVSKILKDLISQVVFSNLFSADFKKLQEEMEASYGLQGDQSFVDDIIRFYDTAGTKAQDYIDALAVAQAEGEKYGLDLFNKTAGSTKKTDPLSGAIKGVSEETASVLAGQFNAIRITNADISLSMRQSLLYQSRIADNTEFNRKLVVLDSILSELRTSNATLTRGFG